MIESEYRNFYRIVRTNPPRLIDFTSNAARGRPEPPDPEEAALWDGLSVYSTLAWARRKQRASPVLGSFIAVVRVPLDGSVSIERTRGGGHYTLRGNAAQLLGSVIAVELR
jgi:hypothetical protein